MTRRVCLKTSKYDVYMGRPGKWGNPFSHKEGTLAEFKVSNRKESIEKHKEWFLKNKELQKDLHELKGKIVGCFCNLNQACHSDIIVECVNMLDNKLF